MTDLRTAVGTVSLPNPVMTASGTAGYGAELGAYVDLGRLGAVVVKSLSPEPWQGNAGPRLRETVAGMLNSVGLQNGGVPAWLDDHLPALRRTGARVVASIWGFEVDDYRRAAELLAGTGPEVVAVEINLSCPNLGDDHRLFAESVEGTAEVVRATAGCNRPRWAKLSPNVTDLTEIAGAALDAGAEAVTLINTIKGMAIAGPPAGGGVGRPPGGVARSGGLARSGGVAGGVARSGGLSGPAIHAVAVRAVFECRRVHPGAGIVGVGGVLRGADAIELLEAGADAVEVGTATFLDPRAPARVLAEVERWCRRTGTSRLADLIGAAHA